VYPFTQEGSSSWLAADRTIVTYGINLAKWWRISEKF